MGQPAGLEATSRVWGLGQMASRSHLGANTGLLWPEFGLNLAPPGGSVMNVGTCSSAAVCISLAVTSAHKLQFLHEREEVLIELFA